ncbi:MAG: hypothetical protein IAE79_24550 [Anaerolinea sp.]|nr:hypothetical protein [Anaerolinea sp.]
MDTVQFRFYADLNDFLPPQQRQRPFRNPVYDGTQSVKHLVESLGQKRAKLSGSATC